MDYQRRPRHGPACLRLSARTGLSRSTVVAVVGDGFQMTNQELATAVQYDLPVKIVIMNSSYLGMVRQWREMFTIVPTELINGRARLREAW